MNKSKKKKKYKPQKLNTNPSQTVLDQLAVKIDNLNQKLFELDCI